MANCALLVLGDILSDLLSIATGTPAVEISKTNVDIVAIVKRPFASAPCLPIRYTKG